MATLTLKKRLYSGVAFGAVGEPCGLGVYTLGHSSIGVYDDHYLIYQRKRHKKRVKIYTRRYVIPYEITSDLQSCSHYFMYCINKVALYLTTDQKQYLESLKKNKYQHWHNVLVIKIQKIRPSYVGMCQLGYSFLGGVVDIDI